MGAAHEQAQKRAWWEERAALQRFVCDLVAAELAVLRPSGVALPPRPWPATLHLVRDLGIDSLELLQLATALSQALHLHEAALDDYLLARPTVGEWVYVAQASLQHFDARLSFRTSGSTGTPKVCTHALADLEQEAAELATLFPGTCRILSAVPAHHIYGFLFSILLPRALGFAQDVQDRRTSAPNMLARELHAGDLVIGHPEFWCAFGAGATREPAGAVGITSTAPCPDDVAEGVLQVGLQRLVQVYGSSETAGVGWRDRAELPYRLFGFWQREAGEQRVLMRMCAGGEQARHGLQDALLWEDERHFRPGGRLDRAVQVGGINVFPARVRDQLLQHPDVLDAAVRLMRPDEGARLKAFIVPREAGSDLVALRARLEAWSAGRMTAAERPRAFTFGAQVPTGPMGKAADWMIG